MREVASPERRARLAVRHHLAREARAHRPADVAAGLAGAHSTDPASMILALRGRLESADLAAIERALYVERSVVRILGMRRTVWVVPVAALPVVQAACTQALVPGERRRAVALLEGAAVAPDAAIWLAQAEHDTLAALEARGEATAAELSEDVPALRERIRLADGKPYAASQGVSSRVLFLLAAEGRIVRGRPLGSWTSTLYKWAPTASWLGAVPEELPVDAARLELARSWLRAFGPGTFADLKWWTGWTAGQLKGVLAELDHVQVRLGSGVGYLLAEDDAPVAAMQPWAALLPSLDPTVMGWYERSWYLGEHKDSLFDRNGNAGPTVWWDGRIVGGWAQRKDGAIAVRLLEGDLGREARAAIDEEAEQLREWLGPLRFVPRFRTPLERELSAVP